MKTRDVKTTCFYEGLQVYKTTCFYEVLQVSKLSMRRAVKRL